jgi:outer membrane protein TolC
MNSRPRLSDLRSVGCALFAAAIASAFARTSHAQSGSPASDTQSIDFAEAMHRARRNVPAVLAAIGQARAAEVQISAAHAVLLPLVTGSLTASGTASNSTTTAVGPGPVQQPLGNADAVITGRWTIWDFGRTALAVRATTANARSAAEDEHNAERVAVAQAAAAYFVVLADQQLVLEFQRTLEQRRQELEVTQGLVHAGTHPPIEGIRAQVTEEQAELDVTSAQVTVETDMATLAAALALDPARPLVVSQPGLISADDNPRHAADVAVATRPEVASARARLLGAEEQLQFARALWRPSLFVSGTGDTGYVEFTNGTGSLRANTTASAGISTPIFDATISVSVHAAEANLSVARANLDQQILNVRTDAAQAVAQVRAARQALAQSLQLAREAGANFDQAHGRYQSGVASILEIVDAQTADANARLGVVRARFQLELAEVRLLAAIGRIDDIERHQ